MKQILKNQHKNKYLGKEDNKIQWFMMRQLKVYKRVQEMQLFKQVGNIHKDFYE